MNVRNIMKNMEFLSVTLISKPDDHIGLELDFIYHLNELCFKAADPNGRVGLA